MPFSFSLKIIQPSTAVTTKLADTLTIDTRVVLSARVRAAVKSAHIAALKARFRRKKVPRTRNSMTLLVAERERRSAMCEERVDVRAVVVLRVGKWG